MLEELKKLHSEAKEIHAKFVLKCLDCDEYYAKNAPPLKELANAILYLRETFELMDEAKKKVNKLKSFVERLLCGRWLAQGTGEPIETDICTARPKVRQVPNLPSYRSRPEDYDKLCDFLGIDPDIRTVPTETNEDGEVIIKQVQRKDEAGQLMTRPVYKRDKKGHILFDKDGEKIVEKMIATMVGEIQYEVKKRKKLVPKMLKTKLKHPHSHEMVDHEIQEVKDLKPRILLLQCRVVGRDTIQKNFCTKCFDKKVKPEMKKFFAFLNGISEKK